MSALRVRAVVVAALVGLAGCSEGEGEVTPEDTAAEGASSEGTGKAYDGAYDSAAYDSAFYDALDEYEGQEVTVVGEVGEVVSPTAFTIEGAEDTEVGPLLVVDVGATGGFEPEMVV